MAISFPDSIKTVYNRVISDIRSSLSYSITFLRNHFFRSIAVAFSTRIFELYEQQKILLIDIFISTAVGEFLDMWGSVIGLERSAATQSAGSVTTFGVLDTIIPAETILTSSEGIEYKSTLAVAVSAPVIGILTLIRNGSTAEAITTGDNNFISGMSVTVTGADQAEYNGTHVITIEDTDKFSYPIIGTPSTPATGTIVVQPDEPFASFPVKSTSFGSNTNLGNGTQLTFQTPIPGIDSEATVQFDGLNGGTDTETDIFYRIKILEKYANPSSPFGIASIIRIVLSVPEVTRSWVKPIFPEVGDASIYFVLDNRTDIVPLNSDIENVRNKISSTIFPAGMSPDFLFVKAPIITDTVFNISGLTPNTLTMQSAIRDNINAFFREEPQLGIGITETIYTSVIANTIDPTNNDRIIDFNLVSPSGTIGGDPEELATYDSTNFT